MSSDKTAATASVNIDGAGTNNNNESKNASATTSVYRNAFLFSFVWWAAIIFFYLNGKSAKTVAACLASTNVITVLEMVPYKLHSPDLQTAVYTINKLYNVQAQFYDVEDNTAGPKATGNYATGGSMTNCCPGLDTTKFREYNKFTMEFPTPNTIAGSTNWMEYKVTFNSADDISKECLSAFTSFNFIKEDGSCDGCWP